MLVRPSALRRPARSTVTPLAVGELEIRLPIACLDDIVEARRTGRVMAEQAGCSGSRIALVMTAISELARNIVMYAREGEIVLSRSNTGGQAGIVVAARDHGPGIGNVSQLFEPGSATVKAGGSGLCSLKRVMDRFRIVTAPGAGTQVTCEILRD